MNTYELHLSTWGRACGAPLAVYKGHLDLLLEDHRKRESDRCANVVSVLARRFQIPEPAVAAMLAGIRSGK